MRKAMFGDCHSSVTVADLGFLLMKYDHFWKYQIAQNKTAKRPQKLRKSIWKRLIPK
ncbi:hypothetical protein NYA22BAC_02537 [Parasphingorhabdus sp. NYA22]